MRSKVHSPFLHNLFVCCGENYQDFVVEINTQIEMKIEELYEMVNETVKNKKIVDDGRSIITNRFRKFVEEKRQGHNNKRNPQYCMIRFYKEISNMSQKLNLPRNENSTVKQSDIDILKSFKTEFDYYRNKDAGAVNDKRLRGLFQNISKGKELNDDQEYLFECLLKIIFPEYIDAFEENLVKKINCKSWEEVAFGDRRHQEMIKNILESDVKYKQVHGLFNKLNEMMVENTEDIRNTLIQISNLLDGIYEEIYDNSKVSQDEENNIIIEYDPIEEDRISELHSHIIAFMRWIPMISPYKLNENVMESVDNVIDQIKVRVCEIIDHTDSLKDSLSVYPVNYQDIIFMKKDGKELRRLLLNAMYKDANICLQFKSFYEEDSYKIER